MLSPAELLGLSGATLDGRLRRAVHDVSDAMLQRVAERLRADALTHEVIYEHEGVAEAVRIMLRPLFWPCPSSSAMCIMSASPSSRR